MPVAGLTPKVRIVLPPLRTTSITPAPRNRLILKERRLPPLEVWKWKAIGLMKWRMDYYENIALLLAADKDSHLQPTLFMPPNPFLDD